MITPYLTSIKIGLAALLIAGLLMLGYRSGSAHVQAKWNVAKLAQAQADQKDEAENRAKEQAYAKQLEDAQNAATKRDAALKTDNNALRAANLGMRDQLNAIREQLPSLTADAVRRYADTASVVLSECQSRYSTLAETTDRLDSERQTLMDAWPK